jgi:hypothetical protein
VLSESARIALLRDQLDQLNEVGNPVRTNVRPTPRGPVFNVYGGNANATGGTSNVNVGTGGTGAGGTSAGGTSAGGAAAEDALATRAKAFWDRFPPSVKQLIARGLGPVLGAVSFIHGAENVSGAFRRGEYMKVGQYIMEMVGGVAGVALLFTGPAGALAGRAATMAAVGSAGSLGFLLAAIVADYPELKDYDNESLDAKDLLQKANEAFKDSRYTNESKIEVLQAIVKELKTPRFKGRIDANRAIAHITTKLLPQLGAAAPAAATTGTTATPQAGQQQTPTPPVPSGSNAPATPATPATPSGDAPTQPAAPTPSGNAPAPQLDNRGRNPELDSLLQSLGLGGARR